MRRGSGTRRAWPTGASKISAPRISGYSISALLRPATFRMSAAEFWWPKWPIRSATYWELSTTRISKWARQSNWYIGDQQEMYEGGSGASGSRPAPLADSRDSGLPGDRLAQIVMCCEGLHIAQYLIDH